MRAARAHAATDDFRTRRRGNIVNGHSKLRRSATIAAVTCACGVLAPGAAADITGVVRSSAGTPLARVYVEATDAAGTRVTSDMTNESGDYTLQFFEPTTFPLTVTYEYDDPCLPPATQTLTTAQPAAADGTMLPAPALPARPFCAESRAVFGRAAEPSSAIVDGAAGHVISPAGGIAYLRLPIPSAATGLAVLLDGIAIGGPAISTFSSYAVQITAPVTGGDGTLTAGYEIDGQKYSLKLGTMEVIGAAGPLLPATGGIDVEVAVDISGSMNGTDPQFLRRDAVRALLALVGRQDRLGALAVDDEVEPIFGLQPVTDLNTEALGKLSDAQIVNRGETDYSVAFANLYEALTQPAVYDPGRPKLIIFVADGGQNSGDYDNGHLRLAANPSGQRWPVCTVQFGSQFQPKDVAALERIATETGGRSVVAPQGGDLNDALRRCLRGVTNQRTIVDSAVTLKAIGKPKRLSKRLGAKVSSAKFFVSYTPGAALTPVLVDPRGGRHTQASPGKNVAFRRSGTFGLFRVLRPRSGTWSVVMTPRQLVAGALTARVSVTVPRK